VKRNLLAILIAIVVTIVLGVPAAFFGGALSLFDSDECRFPLFVSCSYTNQLGIVW
jgi:hypothetical protein